MLYVVLGAVAVLVGGVVAVGALVPAEHVAARALTVHAPPDAVFATLADVAAQPSWRPGLRRVEVLPDADGHRRWREVGRRFAVGMTELESHAPTRRTVEIDDAGQPFGGRWTYELTPTPTGGTRVAITERGFVRGPVLRFLARLVFGYTTTIDVHLMDLARRFGADGVPVDATAAGA